MHKSILTLSGLPGSGKSSTGRKLAEALHLEHYSAGKLLFEIGQKRGLTPDETEDAAESDTSFDTDMDMRIKSIAARGNNFIMDSRIAFHWIPDSFKVFLTIEPEIAAKRALEKMIAERHEKASKSIKEVQLMLQTRLESERKKYKILYQVDYINPSQYDLVIDSGAHELSERVKIIADKYNEWLTK